MDGNFLRILASRCLSAARDCLELRAREEFREIGEALLRKANEIDHLKVGPQDDGPRHAS